MVNSMQTFIVDPQKQLMINYKALIDNRIFTIDSYRSQKRKGRFKEAKIDGIKWVYVNSLTRVSRDKVIDRFSTQSDCDIITAIGNGSNPQYIIMVKQLDNISDPKTTPLPITDVMPQRPTTLLGKWLKFVKRQAVKLRNRS